MKLLPLYENAPRLAVQEVAPLVRDSGCKRCALHSLARNVCIAGDGAPHGVLFVGEAPGEMENNVGQPFVGKAGMYLRELVAKVWHGPVAYENAVRCLPPSDGPTVRQIDTCRPYLAGTVREGFDRIVCLGAVAALSVLGRAVSPLMLRRAYAYMPTTNGTSGTLVLFLPHPVTALRNRFVRAWFEEDLRWALTTERPSLPPWHGQVHVVETAEDAHLAVETVRKAEWAAFDVETAGLRYDPSYRILSVAICPKGSGDAFIWRREALANGAREPLVSWLVDGNARKVGSNTKFDVVAFHAAWGVTVRGADADVRLWRRLLEPEASGKLAVMAELVGMGGHKREAEVERAQKVAAVHRVLAAERRLAQEAPLTKRKKNLQQSIRPAVETTTQTELRALGVDAALEPVVREEAWDSESWSYALMRPDLLARYNGADAVATARLAETLEPSLRAEKSISRVWDEVTKHAARAVVCMEQCGIAIDREAVVAFDTYLAVREASARQVLDAEFPDVNWASASQISDVLFKRLKLPSVRLTKKGEELQALGMEVDGFESTDKDVLEKLRDQHPLVGPLMDFRRVTSLRARRGVGFLRWIRPDGRVHPSFLMDGARTGRLSCKEPQMHNVDTVHTREGRMARDCVVAPLGYVLVEMDQSQVELRVAGALSGDPEMMGIFARGEDFHMMTARLVSRQVWGIEPAQVTSKHRSDVKPVVFGKLYGKSAATFAKELCITLAEARRMLDAVFGRFPVLDRWCQARVAETRKTGLAWSWWAGERARRRSMWRIADVADKARSVAEHGSINTPVQSTASDITLASLGALVAWIREDAVPAKLVLTVHDSVLAEVREDALSEYVWGAREIMTSWSTDFGHGPVPLVVDVKVGKSWGSLATM